MLDAPDMTRPALEDLIELALEAGREILAVRDAGFDTSRKQDGSPVTIADQRAEAIIEAGLARLAPNVPMLGEEATAAGRIADCTDAFFCVDPLDGTKSFVAGGDEFTVNIALIERGAPTMGVVLAPVSGALYAGQPGVALKARCDLLSTVSPELTPIQPAKSSPVTWRVIASRSEERERLGRFLDALGPHTIAHASSSMKFCLVAEGAADLYPRFGDMNEWDAAAGHAIVAAAGGTVVSLDGAPLRYGLRADDFLVRGMIAARDDAAAEVAVRATR